MLTPKDIENKVFKKSTFGGYEINEVENFLEELIVDYEMLVKSNEELNKENAELKDKCSNLQESVAYYKTLESGIEKTISNAKEQADTIKEIAMKEAVNLKAEQELAFQAKIKEYDEKIREKELEFENVKKQIQIYKIKIQSMMEAQLKLLEDCDN